MEMVWENNKGAAIHSQKQKILQHFSVLKFPPVVESFRLDGSPARNASKALECGLLYFM